MLPHKEILCSVLSPFLIKHDGALEHKKSYGKYLSPKDMKPDVLRLMGTIIGGQGSGEGLITLGCNPAPSTY